MAEDYIRAMRAMQPQGPYALGSFCAGSHIAVAMAGRLRRQGEALHPLILIDPPVVPPTEEGRTSREISVARIHRILRRMALHGVFVGKNGRGYFRSVYLHFFSRGPGSRHHASKRIAPDQRFATEKPTDVEKDGRYQGIASSWDRIGLDLIAGSDPGAPADLEAASQTSYLIMKAMRQYELRPFDGDVDAILSEDRAIRGADPGFYLRPLSSELRVHVVGRNHNKLFREHLPDVAKTINDILADAS